MSEGALMRVLGLVLLGALAGCALRSGPDPFAPPLASLADVGDQHACAPPECSVVVTADAARHAGLEALVPWVDFSSQMLLVVRDGGPASDAQASDIGDIVVVALPVDAPCAGPDKGKGAVLRLKRTPKPLLVQTVRACAP